MERYPGKGCKCYAKSFADCACPDVDWRSNREVELEAQLAECRTGLKEILALRALLGKGLLPSDLYPRSEFIARKIIDAAQ